MKELRSYAQNTFFSIQELVRLYQETHYMDVTIHIVETGHSLLREIPGIEISDYKVR